MTNNIDQNYFTLSSPLDEGEQRFFQVHRIEGVEEISADFQYQLTLSSSKPADFSLLLGKKMTLFLGFSTKKEGRYLSGVLIQIEEAGSQLDHFEAKPVFYYRSELRSALWPLSLTRESRIFYDVQNTTLKILVDLLMEYGFDDLANACIRPYEFRSFCVMYNESVMNFCCRMLEREGIFWYWKHEKNGHTLTLGDSTSVLPSCPFLDVAELQTQGKNWTQGNQILSLQASSRLIPGAYAVSDYNPKEPPVYHFQSDMPTGMPKLKMAEYPTDFTSLKGGKRKMKERMYAHEALQNQISGKSTVRSFMVGYKFRLSAQGRPEDGKEYVIAKLKLLATPTSYENEFEAFPADLPYHPLPRAKQPQIQGTQTAVVVGEGNPTEGDCYGSVKVHFHWDRQSKPQDPHSTCPIRVASPFAGGQRGIIFTPHLGDEVVVSFENGDPERPMIIGSVFGPQHSLPFSRGSFPAKSLIKSSEDKNSNQIQFEDQKDQELFHIKAKKDYELEVLHDRKVKVGNDQNLRIKKNHRESIGGTSKIEIALDQTLSIGENQTTEITKNHSFQVGGNYQGILKGDFELKMEGKAALIESTGATPLIIRAHEIILESTTKSITLVSAEDIQSKAAKEINAQAETNINTQAGKNMSVKVEKNLIQDAKGITIKAGKNLVLKGSKIQEN